MAKRWYIVHAYSNFEDKVAEEIRHQAEVQGLADFFEEVLVPTEEVVEVKPGGRKVVKKKHLFPGYVLVKMEMNDATFHLIKNTPKVTGFLGSDRGNKPMPISEEEAARILGLVREGPRPTESGVTFEIGEQVRIIDGPFASFEGAVAEVDEAHQRLKVLVPIFGGETPVDLEYGQVEKKG